MRDVSEAWRQRGEVRRREDVARVCERWRGGSENRTPREAGFGSGVRDRGKSRKQIYTELKPIPK